MSAPPLHPNLQRLLANERRVTRLLSLILFLPMAGFMLFAMSVALRGNTLGDLLFLAMMAGLVLILVVTTGGALAWLHQCTVRRIVAANQLLTTTALPVRLHWSGYKSWRGRWVAVENVEGVPLGYASIATSLGQRQLPALHDVAQLYCKQQQLGTRLVILQEEYALLGRWENAPTAVGQRLWIAAGLLAVLAAWLLSR